MVALAGPRTTRLHGGASSDAGRALSRRPSLGQVALRLDALPQPVVALLDSMERRPRVVLRRPLELDDRVPISEGGPEDTRPDEDEQSDHDSKGTLRPADPGHSDEVGFEAALLLFESADLLGQSVEIAPVHRAMDPRRVEALGA